MVFDTEGPWFATIPEDEWPGDGHSHALIKTDFDSDPSIGDRYIASHWIAFLMIPHAYSI